jgi:hypothetical protein
MKRLLCASAIAAALATVGAVALLRATPWDAEAGGDPDCRVIETRDVPSPPPEAFDRFPEEQREYLREFLREHPEYLVASEVSEVCEE